MSSEGTSAGRRRLVTAVVVSVAAHMLLVLGVSFVRLPLVRDAVRRGEPMMVELQRPEQQPPPPDNPALREPPGAPKSAPRPSRPAPAERPRTAMRVPPAPKATSTPRPVPAPRPLPEPPKVALAAPAPHEEHVRPPDPAAPAEPVAQSTERLAGAPRPASSREPSNPTAPGASADAPRVASLPSGEAVRGGADRSTGRPSVDIRSALRGGGGGGGGGRGREWGGIEGEPIPLDSSDPKFNDYLDRVRRLIKANWGYPCVKNAATRECEYKSATLLVAFGILKNGRLQIVEVRHSSGLPIYDDYAVNAIKLASPFPEVPPSMIRAGSAGLPILATFNYISETSLVNLLR